MVLFQLISCLDEGVSSTRVIEAPSLEVVLTDIIANPKKYVNVTRNVEVYSDGKRLQLDEILNGQSFKLTPESLLKLIGTSRVDGDSGYSLDIFEIEVDEVLT